VAEDERLNPSGGNVKKLINKPEDVVTEALHGIAEAHADLVRVQFNPNVIVRADAPVQGKVGLVSGGGSGHEPMHGGFVGPGMLDAACPGEVFTSPTPDQMLDATKAVNGGAGVLHIVKNYTGDVMNFEMAADLAGGENIEVEAVVIDDDVAVQDSLYTAGRRGVGTTVLAEKICGAAAEEGRSLAEVAELCRKVNANGRSMGMALTSCIVPAAGKPTFELGDDEMEIGIGIHGEAGRERVKLAPAAEIVERLTAPIVEDLPFEQGDQVLAFVNGMGGTPLIELYVVYNDLNRFLGERGITITRNLIGPYITSLEMAGCSITLLKLDEELTRLWDAPVKTVGMTLVSTVGGAGGPLYGTLFIQMGTAVSGKEELGQDDWAAALEAAIAGVQARGKAEPGDKTMIDALIPGRDALKAALAEGASLGDALRQSADAAGQGMRDTVPLVARKGRASYLGERSAGHQDPGATSSQLLLEAAAEAWGGPEQAE